MNREEFEARYELIEQVTRGEIESHHALHHSGVVVMVHIVSAEPSFQAEIERAVLEVGGGPPHGQVLEVHRFDGRTILVTRFMMDFVSVESWIGRDRAPRGETPTVPGAASSPEGAETGSAPGEFTRMFQAPGPTAEPPEMDASAGSGRGAPGPPGPGAGGSPPAGRPGEFTRMFEAPEAVPGDAATEPAPPTEDSGSRSSEPETEGTAPAGDGGTGAGEFTRMFRAPATGSGHGPDRDAPGHPAAEAPTPPPAPRENAPAEEGGGGEFTRMFRAEGVAPSAPPPEARGTPPTPPSPPPRPSPPAEEGPGEFTRFFSAPDTSSTPARPGASPPPTRKTPRVSPPVSEPEVPSWTDALRQPAREPSSPATPETGASPPEASPPPVDGGFTQMFGAERRPVEPGPAARSGDLARPGPSDRGGDAPKAEDAPPPEQAPGRPGPKPGLPRGVAGSSANLDSLLRRPRVPRPRAPAVVRSPTPQNIVRAAAGAIEAASAAKGSGDSGEEARPAGRSRRGIVIGMAVLAVLALAFVIFMALWDFTPEQTEGTSPPQDSVSAPPAEPGG